MVNLTICAYAVFYSFYFTHILIELPPLYLLFLNIWSYCIIIDVVPGLTKDSCSFAFIFILKHFLLWSQRFCFLKFGELCFQIGHNILWFVALLCCLHSSKYKLSVRAVFVLSYFSNFTVWYFSDFSSYRNKNKLREQNAAINFFCWDTIGWALN